MNATDALANRAGEIAMRAAADYIRRTAPGANIDHDYAADRIRFHCSEAFPQALNDAKEAIEANMADVAVQTFAASIRLAGINAAREIIAEAK